MLPSACDSVLLGNDNDMLPIHAAYLGSLLYRDITDTVFNAPYVHILQDVRNHIEVHSS